MHAPGIWGILGVGGVLILLVGRGEIGGMVGVVASGVMGCQKGMKDDEDRPVERVATTTETRETEKKDAL